MIRLRLMVLAIVMMVGWAGAGPAYAEEFVFKVPLRFTSLHPAIVAVQVICEVTDRSGRRVGGKMISVPVNPQNGNLSQDLTVAFNSDGSGVASDAANYRCFFGLGTSDNAEGFPPPSEGSPAARKPKPGTPLVSEVSGPLPKGQIGGVVAPLSNKMSPSAAPITTRKQR